MPSLFTSQTPASNNVDEGTAIATGITLQFTVAGSVTHIRFWAPLTITSSTFTGAIYQVTAGDSSQGAGTGTLLGSATFSSVTADTWNTVALASAVSVDTTHLYRIVVHNSGGRFVQTTAVFGSAITNGNITAPAAGDDPIGSGTVRNCAYKDTGSIAYPNSWFGTPNYFVDVVASFATNATVNASAVAAVAAVPAPAVTTSNPRRVADRGSTQNMTSQTSTAVDLPAGGSITVGNYLIARLAVDNAGASGAAVALTVTDPRSNTWTVATVGLRDPGAANAGTSCFIAYCKVVNAYTNGDDLTFVYDASATSVPAKAIVVEEWANIHATSPVAVAETTANNTTTTPTISRTPTAAGQLFYGAMSVEGVSGDTFTEDTDTTDGPWWTLTRLSTADATATNNQTINGVAKLVTGTSAQTWNPTITSRDEAQVALVFDTAPQQSNATASPSTVAAVAAVPASQAGTGVQIAPAAVAAVAGVGSPTLSTGQKASPGTVTAVAAVPAPQPAGGATASPSTVAVVAAIPAPTPSTGQAGTASASLPGPIGVATGYPWVDGTAVASLGALGATVVGKRTVSGAAAANLGGLVGSAVGDPWVPGAAAASLGQLSASATGARTVTGAAASTLGALTASAAGFPWVDGTATATLGALDATAAGFPWVPGTAAATLGGLNAAATGTREGFGSGAATLAALDATAAGFPWVPGTGSATLTGPTATAAGTPGRFGQATASLGGLSATAVGVPQVLGVAAATLGALDAAAITTPVFYGTATATLGGLTATAAGFPWVDGTAAATLGALTATAVGQNTVTATAAAVLGGLTATATGERDVETGIGHAQLPRVTATALGKRTTLAAAAAVLGQLAATVAGKRIVTGTAGVTLPAVAATATGTPNVTRTGTATATLPALVATITAGGRPTHLTAGHSGNRPTASHRGGALTATHTSRLTASHT